MAMNELKTALTVFFGGFNNLWIDQPIPAYHEQDIPPNVTFPYITYSIALPDSFKSTMLTVNIWDKWPSNKPPRQTRFMGLVDDVLGQARKMIPLGGVALKLAGGEVNLYRGSGDFIIYMDDPNDALIARGIIFCEIRSRVA